MVIRRVNEAGSVAIVDERYAQTLWESAAVFEFDCFLGGHGVILV